MDSLPDHLKALIMSRVAQSRAVVDSSDVLPAAQFGGQLEHSAYEQLLREGWTVVDDFLPQHEWRAVCGELKQLRPRMKQAGMLAAKKEEEKEEKSSSGSSVLDVSFRGDLHLWISDWTFEGSEDKSADYPGVAALLGKLRHLQQDVLRIEHCNSRQTQVTCYPGNGAKYTRHLDASKGRAESRLVTFVYYANDCEWEEKMGGQLRVFLDDGKVKDIAPIGNRLLVFQSRLIEHAVEPCYFERYAISQWVCK